MTKWRQTDPGGYVMVVTIEESIVIYARASRKWFGARARDKTQERIEQLVKAGDWEGARIHAMVKERISQLENNERLVGQEAETRQRN
jgi:hypothetical protein